ncbi:MAG: TIGR02444 family protein [Alphaproteobacteria bacterium]|nr:TIGR02444 family protein [Alphaproteobacteria bacterium]
MAKEEMAEAFWRFSLMAYAREGVAQALIGLQDRRGHNVNLVLFALWHALCRRQRLDPRAMGRARSAVAGFEHDLAGPVRRLRRALKDHSDPDVQAIRRRLQSLEVAAERRAQARLAAVAQDGPSDAGAAVAALVEDNLRLVLGGDVAASETRAIVASLF